MAHAAHPERRGLSPAQAAPLHACWSGRERSEENVWAHLKSYCDSASCGELHERHSQEFDAPDCRETPMTATTTIDWTAQQQASRQRAIGGGGKPGLARTEQLVHKSGLEILEAMMAGELP